MASSPQGVSTVWDRSTERRGVMLLCDLLVVLVLLHASPSLVHALWCVFVVFAGAAMVPLLLGTLLLQTSIPSRSPDVRNAQHTQERE